MKQMKLNLVMGSCPHHALYYLIGVYVFATLKKKCPSVYIWTLIYGTKEYISRKETDS